MLPAAARDESLAERPRERGKAKKAPRVELSVGEIVEPWGELVTSGTGEERTALAFADLARAEATQPALTPASYRVHDRTHIEFAIDYPFAEAAERFVFETFFFVPASFRLDETTYDKKQIYEDLLSYVRVSVPRLSLAELADAGPDGDSRDAPLVTVTRALDAAVADARQASAALRALRLFACVVRGSTLEGQRTTMARIERADTSAEERVRAARLLCARARGVLTAFREAALGREGLPEDVAVGVRWIDEDLSLVVESFAASLSIRARQLAGVEGKPGLPGATETAQVLAALAVGEARYRKDRGYPSVGSGRDGVREFEHLEFRRHMLRRFTSSALWLTSELRAEGVWVVHTLYAFAAALAMTFAVWATLHASQWSQYMLLYAVLLVGAYAIKDRMKAILQSVFSRWVEKRFPDRRRTIRVERSGPVLAEVRERAAFRPFSHVGEGVLEARRRTREHALEEEARPERVLWHEKSVLLRARPPGPLPPPTLTEIFRLNLAPWLQHTDDPNRVLAFADPDDASICTVTAPRVYNINVVFRLRRANDRDARFHRVRVVVSRKGVLRIDPIG